MPEIILLNFGIKKDKTILYNHNSGLNWSKIPTDITAEVLISAFPSGADLPAETALSGNSLHLFSWNSNYTKFF